MEIKKKISFRAGLPILLLVVASLAGHPSQAQVTASTAITPGYAYPNTANLSRRELRREGRLMRKQGRLKVQEGRDLKKEGEKMKGRSGREMRREARLTRRQGRLMKRQGRELHRESHDRPR